MPATISDELVAWCKETPSVTDVLAKEPGLSAGEAAKRLFGKHRTAAAASKTHQGHHAHDGASSPSGSIFSDASDKSVASSDPTPEELERALSCGKFGNTKPSELFSRIWHDALLTLEHDPLAGCISPSLMGASGTVPFTVIGNVWDMCRHMVSRSGEATCQCF
jgi:hypothetical protein